MIWQSLPSYSIKSSIFKLSSFPTFIHPIAVPSFQFFSIVKSLIMAQPKKQAKVWLERLAELSPIPHKNVLATAQEEMIISRGQLSSILEQFASREELHLSNITKLTQKNSELVKEKSYLLQECERSKHLLSIKQQFCLKLQKEIDDLRSTAHHKKRKMTQGQEISQRRYTRQANYNQEQQDLNELSKIESIDSCDDQKENRGAETKRKICLKKSIKNNVGFKTQKIESLQKEGQQLEIAKLKAEVCGLKEFIAGLQIQLQILEIENSHNSRECEITNRRERRLNDSLQVMLKQQNQQDTDQHETLNKKCIKLQMYIDKLTEKVSQQTDKFDHPQLNHPPPLRRLQDVPPPITPHFSSTTFVFPQLKKTPTKSENSPPDEIFQAYNSFLQQDEPQKE